MAVESLTNPRENLPNTYTDVAIREIDFVSRFGDSWKNLQNILGIMDLIPKESGTKLASYRAEVTLADGDVDAGCVIPYSKAGLTELVHGDVTIQKYAKATTIEEVSKYGVQNAIERTDNAFLNKLQSKVMGDFYTFLLDDTYALTDNKGNFQKAVARAIGLVRDKFDSIDKEVSDVVVFASINDAYEYLGEAGISTQTAFGIEYVQNFMGAKTMFLTSKIPDGKVVAVPTDNIVGYYVDPASSDFAKLGLSYTTDGETNLIGFHVNGNYGTAVGENFAIMGIKLWAEYADGIAIVSIDANPLNAPAVAPVSGSTTEPWGGRRADSFQQDVTVSNGTISGKLKFVEGGLAPSGYLAGDGYFMYLALSSIAGSATSLLVGLQPSAGSGLQEAIDDPDKTVVCKVSGNDQKFVTIISNDDHMTKKVYKLDFDFVDDFEAQEDLEA